jgi:hypothetical protein
VGQITNTVPELSLRWTKEMLRSCTPREILVLVGEFGPVAIAKRLGYTDVAQFLEEKSGVKSQ